MALTIGLARLCVLSAIFLISVNVQQTIRRSCWTRRNWEELLFAPSFHSRRIVDFLFGMAIPIIDLSNLLNSIPTFEETTAIRKACLDFGFFYVVNHGISRDLQANVLGNLWKFFNLSAEKKNEVHRNDGFRGYFRKEEERSIEYNCTEWKEGIYYFRDFNNVPKERKEKVFCGLNPWPKAEYVPEFRAVIEEYFRKTQELASKLLSCIALSLGKQL